MAALTVEAFLEACRPVHAGLTARRHDLVGVGFGAGGRSGEEEEGGVILGRSLSGRSCSLLSYSLGGDVDLLQLAVRLGRL